MSYPAYLTIFYMDSRGFLLSPPVPPVSWSYELSPSPSLSPHTDIPLCHTISSTMPHYPCVPTTSFDAPNMSSDSFQEVYPCTVTPIRDLSLSPPVPVQPDPVPLVALAGRIVSLSKEESGSRLLLRILQDATRGDIETLYSEFQVLTETQLSDLLTRRHAASVFQRIFELCDCTQRSELIELLAPSIRMLGCNERSTYPIRKVVESLESVDQASLFLKYLCATNENHTTEFPLLRTLRDRNGAHVIRRLLQRIKHKGWLCEFPDLLDPFLHQIVSALVYLAKSAEGCSLLEYLFSMLPSQSKAFLVGHVLENTGEFLTDPYGITLLSYILDFSSEYVTAHISRTLLKFADDKSALSSFISRDHSAEFVIKLFASASTDIRDLIILWFVEHASESHSSMDLMYFVQSIANHCTDRQKGVLYLSISSVREHGTSEGQTGVVENAGILDRKSREEHNYTNVPHSIELRYPAPTLDSEKQTSHSFPYFEASTEETLKPYYVTFLPPEFNKRAFASNLAFQS